MFFPSKKHLDKHLFKQRMLNASLPRVHKTAYKKAELNPIWNEVKNLFYYCLKSSSILLISIIDQVLEFDLKGIPLLAVDLLEVELKDYEKLGSNK